MRSTGQALGFQLEAVRTASAALEATHGRRGRIGRGADQDDLAAVALGAGGEPLAARAGARSQPGAAAQPSSTTRTSGPSPLSSGSGLSTGPASARITSVASSSRSSRSQGGVRAEVSSSGSRPSRKRIAGKRM